MNDNNGHDLMYNLPGDPELDAFNDERHDAPQLNKNRVGCKGFMNGALRGFGIVLICAIALWIWTEP